MALGLLQRLRGLATSPRRTRRSESTVELLEFEAERKLWLENVTRDSLLQDFSREVSEDGPEDCYKFHACFRPLEVKAIRDIFDSQSVTGESITFWTEDTVFAYLNTRLSPSLGDDFSSCMSVISRSILYSASYPFSPSETGIQVLVWDALIRSLAFLTCRDKDVFLGSFKSFYYRDGELVEEHFGRERTEIIRSEDFFRSLALPYGSGHRGNRDAHNRYKEDVLDVLYQVQPKLKFETRPLPNEILRPVAYELSSGRCPLECYYIPKSEFIRLLNFFSRMVDSITMRRGEGPSELAYRLRASSTAIATITKEKLTFADIQGTGRTLRYLHYAFAVLFDAFIPKNEEPSEAIEFFPRNFLSFIYQPPQAGDGDA